MVTLTPRNASRRNRLALIIVTVLSVGMVAGIVPPYLGLEPDASKVGIRPDIWFHFPVLVVHIVSGGIALALGPWQFMARIRRRWPRWHRVIGRTYLLAGILPASLSGFVVAMLTVRGPVAAAGFALLDVAWLMTAVVAYRAVRRRDFVAHERWMRRNFALTFAGVTLRCWLGLLIMVQLPILESFYGGDFDRLFTVAYLIVAWLSWVPNMIFMEWWLRRGSGVRGSAQPLTAPRMPSRM